MQYNACLSADSIVPGAGPLTLSPHDATAVNAWASGGGGPANPQDLNRYSYTLNNPLNATDPTGHWLESALDIAAISYDIYDISQNGLNWTNGLALAADVASLALPVVAGGGMAVRAAMHADDAIDAVGAVRKSDNLVDAVGDTCRVNSFSADTPVATPDGDVPIATLEIGDLVYAWDETTDTTGVYTITDTINHIDPVIVLLTIGDETLETTAEHPFYTLDRGWVNAEDLRFGDRVPQLDGEIDAVRSIAMVQRTQPMYNLTVAVAHTFFVGDEQRLVHNCNDDAFAPAFQALNEAIDKISDLSKTQRDKISTMVGAVDIKTGNTAVGIKRSRQCTGMCAEDIAVELLGADPKDVLFTPAYRPRDNDFVDVCTRCQLKYDPSQFAPGTKFAP